MIPQVESATPDLGWHIHQSQVPKNYKSKNKVCLDLDLIPEGSPYTFVIIQKSFLNAPNLKHF